MTKPEKQLEPKKDQLCYRCFKPIKGEWAYNGHFWHMKCKNKDSKKRISEYLKTIKNCDNSKRYEKNNL